jgi:hypothetical protein
MEIFNSDYNGFILFALAVMLLLLIYILYYYNFSSRVYAQTAIIDYPSKINLVNLPTCDKIDDPMNQYILSDYYIAASANSICVGNQKYDYVSTDILSKVLSSGARYIEIPICQSYLSQGSPPVVATGQLTGQWITSINTLDTLEVFTIIRSIAFSNVNYPLFINLKLYTTDKITLNQLAKTLRATFKGVLINPAQYQKVPISMERVCILLKKVIIFCSDNYQQSDLVSVICPSNGYINRIYYNNVSSFNIPTNDPNYPKILSKTQQTQTTSYFESKYPDLASVVGKTDFLGELKADKKILDVLTNYNKAGLSVVYPHLETDTFSANYSPSLAWEYGCTFVAMNYQVYDDNMSLYIDTFKKSSFILKPAGFRFSRKKDSVIDINALVPEFTQVKIPIINDFMANVGDKLMSIKTFVSNNYYIVLNGDSLVTANVADGNFNSKNTFIFIPTWNKKYQGGVMIQSNAYPNMFISLNMNNFYLARVDGKDKTSITAATFYPVAPKCGETDYFSLRCITPADGNIPQYLGVSEGKVIAVNEDPSSSTKAAVCFQVKEIPSYKTAIIANLQNLYLFTDSDGSIFMEDAVPKNKPEFSYKILLASGNSFTDPRALINLMSMRNNKFLLVQNDNKIIANGEKAGDKAAQFKIDTIGGGLFTIKDYMGRFMIEDDNNFISFLPDSPLLQEEKKDEDGKIIQPAIYGAALGNTKFHQIYIQYSAIA